MRAGIAREHHMSRTLLGGAVLAIFGALTIVLGDVLGLELDDVAFLGIAMGAVIGLVPDRSPLARIAGFFAGVVVALIFFALRANALPDTTTGRAVAVLVALLACAIVSVLTTAWVPLWAILVGATAVIGAYENTFVADPSVFLDEAPAAVTAVLLAAAMGHLATTIFGPDTERRVRAEYPEPERPGTDPSTRDRATSDRPASDRPTSDRRARERIKPTSASDNSDPAKESTR